MAITPISVNAVLWDQGDPGGALRPKGNDVYVVGNPGGGDPGVVLVPGRSQPFTLSVVGCFDEGDEPQAPDVLTWKGLSVEVIRFGVTLQCVITEVRVTSRTTVWDNNAPRTCLAVTFDMIAE